MAKTSRKKRRILRFACNLIAIGLIALACGSASGGEGGLGVPFFPHNLVVTRSVYDNNPNNVTVGETLPPGCTSGCGAAINNGTYPQVFNNDASDGSFGITSKIFLDQITPFGFRLGSLEVPNNSERWFPSGQEGVVTSFSSKSELALNLSTDRKHLTFMGYEARRSTLSMFPLPTLQGRSILPIRWPRLFIASWRRSIEKADSSSRRPTRTAATMAEQRP